MNVTNIFDEYAIYYNSFYEDKNYAKEAETVKALILKYKEININTIIDLGCGTGKHDIELLKNWKGVQIDGVDLSETMIECAISNANANNVKNNYYIGDIRNLSLSNIYDAAISLFHVMSYQNTNEDIISAFNSTRKILRKGGLFLFDTWYGPGVLTERPSVRIKKVENNDKELIRIATPILHQKNNVVDVAYEVFIIDKECGNLKRINEIHSMRYFFYPEIKLLLKKTGFELIDCIDCEKLSESSFDSWTVYFIARAV